MHVYKIGFTLLADVFYSYLACHLLTILILNDINSHKNPHLVKTIIIVIKCCLFVLICIKITFLLLFKSIHANKKFN